MDENVKNEANDILARIGNQNIKNEVEYAKITDPAYALFTTLADFFMKRMAKIQEQDSLIELVRRKLIQKIDADELSITQLMGLFSNLKRNNLEIIDSFISLAKPSKEGANSPLLDKNKDNANDEILREVYDSLSPEERRTVDKVLRFIQ